MKKITNYTPPVNNEKKIQIIPHQWIKIKESKNTYQNLFKLKLNLWQIFVQNSSRSGITQSIHGGFMYHLKKKNKDNNF